MVRKKGKRLCMNLIARCECCLLFVAVDGMDR
jgi:hypothetical protein